MPTMDFFPQRPPVSPKIYAYELIGVASHRGYIKVGYTERDVDVRIKEQTHTVAVPYRVLETWPAMRSDGSCFTDKDLHAVLRRKGFRQLNEGEDRNEWFRCTVNDVKAAVYAVRNRTANVENRRGQNRGLFPFGCIRRLPEIFVELQNAVWQNLCGLPAGKANGLQTGAGAYLQTCCGQRMAGRFEHPQGF